MICGWKLSSARAKFFAEKAANERLKGLTPTTKWINKLSRELTGSSFDEDGDVFFVHGVCRKRPSGKSRQGISNMVQVWSYLEDFLVRTGCIYMLLINDNASAGGKIWIKKGFRDLQNPSHPERENRFLKPFRIGLTEFALGYGQLAPKKIRLI